MIKYYIKINVFNEVLKLYSNENFNITNDLIEVSENELNVILNNINKGKLVKYINNEIIIDNLNNSSNYVKNSKIKYILNELSSTDRTQMLNSGLTDEKVSEFADYKTDLRIILNDLNNGSDPFAVVLPNRPSYE